MATHHSRRVVLQSSCALNGNECEGWSIALLQVRQVGLCDNQGHWKAKIPHLENIFDFHIYNRFGNQCRLYDQAPLI